MTHPHRTPSEKRAHAAAQAAIARAYAHTRHPPANPPDDHLARLYPYVTPARAQQIRHEIEEDRHA